MDKTTRIAIGLGVVAVALVFVLLPTMLICVGMEESRLEGLKVNRVLTQEEVAEKERMRERVQAMEAMQRKAFGKEWAARHPNGIWKDGLEGVEPAERPVVIILKGE